MQNFYNSFGRLTYVIGGTLLFGIFGTYLFKKTNILSQLTDRRAKKKKSELCNVCFIQLDTEDIKTCTPCCHCKKSVCRGKNCSYWLPKLAKWECQLCNLSNASQSRTKEWINKQVKTENEIYHPIRARSELNIPILDDRLSTTQSLNHIPTYSPASSTLGVNSHREKIRNHVEEILADMLGGSLDNISVGPMSKNKQYLPLWESNSTNNLDTNNPTNISHIKLKRLIERIVEETIRIPQLTEFSGVPPPYLSSSDNHLQLQHHNYDRRQQQQQQQQRYRSSSRRCSKISHTDDYDNYDEMYENNPQYFDPKRYQELLATAVLNKIVDTCAIEKKSIDDANKIRNIDNNHNKILITKELCDASSSSSSHDPRSDSSLPDPIQDVNVEDINARLYADILNENIDRESILSDSLATYKNIPDIISSDNDSIEDFVSVASGADSTWEENWLFKKRKLLTHPTGPIGMLVPAPREDVKAMIGDKSADEISDFSENEEDGYGNDNRNDSGPENDRIQNKIVIGGQNTVGLFDDLMEQTSLISKCSSSADNESYIETTNDYVDFKYGLNVKEEPSLDLTCGGITLKTEAINTAFGVHLLKNEESTVQIEPENSNNISSPINIPKRTSSDSTITDESTHTILDATDEAQILTPTNENQNNYCSPTRTYINGNENENNPKDESILRSFKNSTTIETDSDSIVIVHDENFMNMEINDRSIAEREHKKWYNAVEMPNNPYTPEALLRRLDNGPEILLDIPQRHVSSNTEIASPEEDEEKEEEIITAVKLNPKKIDLSIYSRDYYVPISKTNITKNKLIKMQCFENDHQQQTKISNDDKELLNKYNNEEQTLTKSISDEINTNNEPSIEQSTINEICDNKITVNLTLENNKENIFSAKLIQINDLTDEEQTKSTLNISLISDKLKADSSPSDISLANSLTLSEDSDTLRIYNLNNKETTFILKENQKQQQQEQQELKIIETSSQDRYFNDITNTPPNTPITPTTPTLQKITPKAPRIRPNELKLQQTSSQSPTKICGKTAMVLTPQSFKFLHPKRKIIEPSQILTQEQYTTPPETPDKIVIEEEIVHTLPSVKALAKAFLLTQGKLSEVHNLNVRPKSLIVETTCDKFEIKDQIKKTISQENLVLSTQKVSNDMIKQDENQNNITISERPLSPVLLTPGKLKDNIAFFENLKKN